MSEKNNIFENDLLMRAILEKGQEEVPARVWDGVVEGLDKAARKTVILRWRRAIVSVAAVAAAVAAVFVLDRPEEDTILPAAVHGDMIAVVETGSGEEETVEGIIAEPEASNKRIVAYVPKKTVKTFNNVPDAVVPDEKTEAFVTEVNEEVGEIPEETAVEEVAEKEVPVKENVESVQTGETREYFPEVWEEEKPSRHLKTSVVVSGITGKNGSASHSGPVAHRAPALIMTPDKTGIKEKTSTSEYGLPVSVGAGVRIALSPKWALGAGLNYTYLTRTFNGTYTHVNEEGVIDNLLTSDIRNSQHYLGIPVNAYYTIIDSRNVNFYAYAGGAVEKCLYDKYTILSNSIVHKEAAKGVQLSANIGVGVEFMLGEHLGLYLDPSLRYYFDCNQPKSIRTSQPLMLGFELGFRFNL